MCFKDLTIVGPHNHPLSLDSGNSVKRFLKAAAVDFGRKKIALTDHGTMGAIIEAHDYTKELKKKDNVDLEVIPGIEAYLLPAPDDDSGWSYYHVTIHFDDFQSYLEGCKLSKSSFDRAINKGGELKALLTWEELESLSGKVTLFSSCLVGAVQRPWLKNRKDISERNFVRLMNIAGPNRFYAEIFPYEVSKNWNSKTKIFEPVKEECSVSGMLQVDANKWVMELAKKYNVPMVISEDAHYAHESDKFLQDMKLNKDGKSTWKMADANCLHSTDWLYKELKRLHPEYITESTFVHMVENSYKAAENFKGFDPKFKHSLPIVNIDIKKSDGTVESRPPQTDDELTEYILRMIVKKNRIDLNNPEYAARINKELEQLAYNGKINILPYFLPLNAIVDKYETHDKTKIPEVLVGPGRGSAAGSLVTYALGITSVDPIKEDLMFERFFDVTRVEEGLADIDTDFSDRNKVVQFIKENWGDKFVFLGIGTTFKTKSTLKDIDRHLHGEVRKETEAVCKTIGVSPQGSDEESFLKGYTDADGNYHTGELETNESLKEYLRNNPKAEEYLMATVGMIRQMGRHAAGVLIADKPVHNFIPIMSVGGEPTTQLLPKWVEKCGGIKYDILGLNTLEDIRLCLKHIQERTGKVIDIWNIEDNPIFWEAAINEPSTIFQLHTPTVRVGLQTMRPKTVQEAAILTSVFRPGAMDAISDEDPSKTMADIFLERWTGRRPVSYVHPDLEPILGPTKAVIVYQEQIMRIVHELGGLTMPETNQLRKAISKKTGDALIQMLNKVKTNLIEKKGWTETQATTIADQMKASGRYCFNKSHAISYCYIARACAYLKYYYPLEWWTSVLTNASKDDLRAYWQNMSSIILPPDINLSGNSFTIREINGKDYILSPLNMIDGIGETALKAIEDARPFNSLEEMLKKINRTKVHKGVMIKLIFSGILDHFFEKGIQEHEKIQIYLNKKAEIEGKKTPEAVPLDYIAMTPLKFFLMKKSIFKVYNDNLTAIALQKMLTNGLAVQEGKKTFIFKKPNEDLSKKRVIISGRRLEEYKDDGLSHRVAVICYILKTKEATYANNKKTRLIINAEIEDKVFEFIKWPGWKSDHHGVKDDVEESVSVLLLSSREGGDLFVDEIYMLENLTFLKEKESNESTKPKRSKKKVQESEGNPS